MASKFSGRGRTWAPVALAIIAAWFVAAGCASRVTKVDASYDMPEGTASAKVRLFLWEAGTTSMPVYQDETPLGPSPNDPLVRTETIFGEPLGTIQGLVIDGTEANQFEILRREPGGGYRAYQDFDLMPIRKWIPEQWEAYQFLDHDPSSFQPPSYIGRGVVDGLESKLAPLSNEARVASGTLGNIDINVTAAPDTISIVNWTQVTGATDYLIHIYEFRFASVSQQQKSGLPSPLYVGQSRDHFLLWFHWQPGMSVPRYKLGDSASVNINAMPAGTPSDLTTLYARDLLPQPEPVVGTPIIRISAYDADGRMIARSLSPTSVSPRGSGFPRNFGIANVSDLEYGAFPLGGQQVTQLRLPR